MLGTTIKTIINLDGVWLWSATSRSKDSHSLPPYCPLKILKNIREMLENYMEKIFSKNKNFLKKIFFTQRIT